ncbi:hypothetical protein BCR34DRAFT_161121 [Clohesyomyces aquaticus]|uniref:Uncharacterized protein n=1 Tax=Clohesyomyces aquaticus TaxID=1231657 RepID=A0A1Y1ZZS1_9PLEO|nr:hypothetical protein BCR34DRAFT_161121 [Clohesyomyces aquaticus]
MIFKMANGVLRLCWVLFCLLPLVLCEFGSNDGKGFGGKGGKDGKGFDRFHGGGGGRFGQDHGKKGGFGQGAQGQQGGAQDPSSQEQAQAPAPTVAESSAAEPPSSAAEPPSSTAVVQASPEPTGVPALVSAASGLASPIPIFVPPSSIISAAGAMVEPSIATVATVPLDDSSITMSDILDTAPLTSPIPMPTSTVTVVTSMTVIVTPTPIAISDPTPAAIASPALSTTTIDLAPLSTSPGTTMSSSAKAAT